jgi:hypothetical protein
VKWVYAQQFPFVLYAPSNKTCCHARDFRAENLRCLAFAARCKQAWLYFSYSMAADKCEDIFLVVQRAPNAVDKDEGCTGNGFEYMRSTAAVREGQ